MNLKDLIIRNKETKTLKELQSWTVTWDTCTDCISFGFKETFHKVFTDKKEAEEFMELLQECRRVTKSWIKVSIKEN